MIDYPKVSVVTITYGHEKYIRQTLDGVLMQKYPGEIEFIIANDNSPDSTDKIIATYLSQIKIPKNFIIRYTKHGANKGVMPNFISSLKQASGKYIALCEGDDYWTDSLKLQKQVDFLESNLVYIACGCYVDIERFGELEKNEQELKKVSYSKTQLFFDWPFATLTTLFRNIPINPLLRQMNGGDLELFLYLSKFGNFMRLDFLGGVYRYHGNGLNSGCDYYTNSEKHISIKLESNKKYDLQESTQVKKMLNHYIQKELIKVKYILVGKYEFKKSFYLINYCLKLYRNI